MCASARVCVSLACNCTAWVTSDDAAVELITGVFLCLQRMPIKACSAITVHAAQGQTFARARLKNEELEFFAPGQLYIAISRVKTLRIVP